MSKYGYAPELQTLHECLKRVEGRHSAALLVYWPRRRNMKVTTNYTNLEDNTKVSQEEADKYVWVFRGSI